MSHDPAARPSPSEAAIRLAACILFEVDCDDGATECENWEELCAHGWNQGYERQAAKMLRAAYAIDVEPLRARLAYLESVCSHVGINTAQDEIVALRAANTALREACRDAHKWEKVAASGPTMADCLRMAAFFANLQGVLAGGRGHIDGYNILDAEVSPRPSEPEETPQ